MGRSRAITVQGPFAHTALLIHLQGHLWGLLIQLCAFGFLVASGHPWEQEHCLVPFLSNHIKIHILQDPVETVSQLRGKGNNSTHDARWTPVWIQRWGENPLNFPRPPSTLSLDPGVSPHPQPGFRGTRPWPVLGEELLIFLRGFWEDPPSPKGTNSTQSYPSVTLGDGVTYKVPKSSLFGFAMCYLIISRCFFSNNSYLI